MPFSKLLIDDKTLELEYDFNTLCDLEDEVACNLLAGIESQGSNTAKQLRGLFYAMTREKHADLTLADLGRLIRMDTIARITMAIGEACALAVSEEFAEKWRRAVMTGRIPEDQEDSERTPDEPPPAPRTGHLDPAELEAYAHGGESLAMGDIRHAEKCPACLVLLDKANSERLNPQVA